MQVAAQGSQLEVRFSQPALSQTWARLFFKLRGLQTGYSPSHSANHTRVHIQAQTALPNKVVYVFDHASLIPDREEGSDPSKRLAQP
jgi:hypothetical protein